MTVKLRRILEAQRKAFHNEAPVSSETRIDRLDRCIALIVDHKDELCAAVDRDFGCRSRHVTQMNDMFPSLATLKFVRKNLKKWMRPERRRSPFPMGLLGARSEIHYQPKGVVGIMSPWNVPVNMVFSPLADVLGAGNRAMVKPSEYNPHTVELLQKLFTDYFEETEVAIISGDASIGAAFAALPLDHLMFTGSTAVGKQVMKAAAENLTPVTLELGGKSPVVVSDSADISEAAEKIMTIKAMNAGQVCISPDYCFVPRAKLERFVNDCRVVVLEQYPTVADNPDFVSMVNDRNFDRVMDYIEDAREKDGTIEVLGPEGQNPADGNHRKIPVHLIVKPSNDMAVMQEELFGPVLCVKPYDSIDECIEFISGRPHPLALYYIGEDDDEKDRFIAETTSGGMCINDLAIHFACDDLPFGGIGPSGMGHYHGREGFRTFSHARSVFLQGPLNLPKLSGTLPPYGDKVDRLLTHMIKR